MALPLRLIWIWAFIVCLLASACVDNSVSEADMKNDVELEIAKFDPANALKFINAYVENCNKAGDAAEAVVWAQSNALATPAFKSTLYNLVTKANEADPEIGLGYDPILNAQDYPQQGFILDSVDKLNGLVYLKDKETGAYKLTMKLVENKGQWLVDGCGVVNIPEENQK